MSKTKTPFFSLGSRGTVADALTSQKRGGITLLREKPIPTDPYSLAQAYQRWLYQDYAAYWSQQSLAVKQLYAADGVRHHLTGFQYWMKYHLADLPDLALYAKLDTLIGTSAIDSSRHLNHGTIFGASYSPGRIDGCLHFDGINDRVLFPDQPYYTFGNGVTDQPFSTLAFVNMIDSNLFPIICKGATAKFEWLLWSRPPSLLQIRCYSLGNPGKYIGRLSTVNLLAYDNTWIHLAATYDGSGLSAGFKLYLEGAILPSLPSQDLPYVAMQNYNRPVAVGVIWETVAYGEGYIDQLELIDREVTLEEIKTHSERRHR